MDTKPRVAIHKFSSCDGCQLAFLNAGEQLLTLLEMVDMVHFAEAGIVNPEARADIAFIEGSISTPEEQERIREIRENTRYLVAIGACATAGGLQALRNLANAPAWIGAVYAHPEYIHSLDTATAISRNVHVDFELWGCPVNTRQVLAAVRALLFGVPPIDDHDKLCLDCKRRNVVCVMVAKGIPCMGPLTRTGCGALCPRFGRDCYGCYGPAENPNAESWGRWVEGMGFPPDRIARRFLAMNNGAPDFEEAGRRWQAQGDRPGGKEP